MAPNQNERSGSRIPAALQEIWQHISHEHPLMRVLLLYMLLQPLADVFTSLCVRADISLTFGVVFRTLFMLAAGIYVFFDYRGRGRGLFLTYFILLILYCAAFLGHYGVTGGTAVLMTEVKGLVKIIYFPVVTVALLALWLQYGCVVSRPVLSAVAVIYMAIIVLAMVTGTSFVSYKYGVGYNGWFYAANEIGAILACLCPMVLLGCGQRVRGWWRFLPMLLVALIASYVGTKVVFFCLFGYMVLYLGWNAFAMLAPRLKERRSQTWRALVAALLCCVTVGIYFAYSPLYQNLQGFAWRYDQTMDPDDTPSPVQPDVPEDVEPGPTLPEVDVPSGKVWKVLNWLLSNRLRYMQLYLDEAQHFGVAEKLLGMGYAGLPQIRSLELDFLALYFQNGLIGLPLLCLPLVAMCGYVIWYVFARFKRFITDLSTCTYAYAFLVLLAVAITAGHTVVAPAVSIYFPLLFLLFLQQVSGKAAVEEK